MSLLNVEGNYNMSAREENVVAQIYQKALTSASRAFLGLGGNHNAHKENATQTA